MTVPQEIWMAIMWIGGGVSVCFLASLAGPYIGGHFRQWMEQILP